MSDTESDNWSSLLDEFGIDEPAVMREKETPESAVSEKVAVLSNCAVAAVAEDNTAIAHTASPDVPVNPKERKSIFSRFPKINLFGTLPKESLDAIAGGGKAALPGGKSFTGHTIEKAQGVVLREERKEEPVGNPRACGNKEHRDEDALPAIVSQLDAFASAENLPAETAGSRRSRRQPVSMFEEPVPKAEDYEAAQKFFGEPTGQRRNRTDFEEAKEESSGRGRGRSNRNTQAFEEESFDKPARERGGRRLPVIDDVTIDEEWQEVDEGRKLTESPRRCEGTFQSRERSSSVANNAAARGAAPKRYGNAVRHDIDDAPAFGAANAPTRDNRSREHGTREYVGRERTATPAPYTNEYTAREPVIREREEYSTKEEGKPQTDHQRQRGGRGRKIEESRQDYPQPVRREYEPQYEQENAAEESSEQVQLHRNIPGWDDAVGDIVAGNIARHRNNPPQPYRSKR
ncbi:MAG: hypothetical protein LBT46_06195 [Planctomycetaceae bacterium]|nr:hypothetical protein [Planctomycetaceae bacterium]